MFLSPEHQSMIVTARSQERFCGAPIGVLLCDEVAPFIPGSVGNAGTFSLPARYKVVPGLTGERVLGPDAAESEQVVVDTAVALASEGARMITSNCGFTARFQRAVSEAVDVPVLLSSFLLVPFLESMLPRTKTLGIITGDPESLTTEFISAANLTAYSDRIVVAGLDKAPAFASAFNACVGSADIPAVAREVVEAAEDLLRRRPDVGILLLECSELPPYAAAVQRATGVPVFDFTSLIDFFAAGLRRTAFEGFM